MALGERPSVARQVMRVLVDRESTFAGGSGIMVVANALSGLVSVVTSVLIARALGPEQLGFVTWFITGTTAVGFFADVAGIYYSGSYLIASGAHRFRSATVTSTVIVYGLAVGLLAGVVFGLLDPVRGLLFHGLSGTGWGVLICINICGLSLLTQVQGLLLGRSKFLALAMLGLARVACFAVLAVYALMSLHWRAAAEFAALQSIATWLSLAAVLAFLSKGGLSRPTTAFIRACLPIGGRAAVINWVSFLHTRIDQYLVYLLLGPAALGVYGVVVSLAEVLTRIPSMLGMVLFSRVASGVEGRDQARNTERRMVRVMVLSAVVAALLAVLAPTLIHVLYGPRFASGALLLQLLLPAVVFLSGALIVNNHAAGLGYPPALVVSTVVGLLLNVLLNLWLLPRLGTPGASVASSVTYGVQLGIMIYYLRTSSGTGWVDPTARVDRAV